MTYGSETPPARQRVLVVGYGVAGVGIAADARSHGHEVVGFLDDVKRAPEVLGALGDVNRVVREHHIDSVYFAIPTVDAKVLRDFLSGLEKTGLRLSILPRTYKTISSETVSVSDLTDVDVLQLVGRQPIKHDLLDAQRMVGGKRALVTGAAGSIGSRLVEHLLTLGTAQVVAVDWWETGLFHLENRLADDRLRVVVADVKNESRIAGIFAEYRPELVFHAAAYKHVPLMEDNPMEAVANNAFGAENVLRQAITAGASHAVYVSTDKAVRPANVMGSSKRLGELLLSDLAQRSGDTKLTAVRFGNVLQSNGSVMETFRRQIEAGGPLTVTHRDVTRFFMTIDEAAQLIIQSALLGSNGDICVLDMGEPVRILDLAESLVRATAPHVRIDVTQLRPGEKLYEELTYNPDLATSTANSKVFILQVEDEMSIPAARIRALIAEIRSGNYSDEQTIAALRDMGFNVKERASA
ncbi:FlaA1/EpsC-like NDP-sugar epimerase [Microbacterium sp. ZKA21]|uniref:polysaccharide biosynthesis protein n=1 Tax=Microbacterium sp. ZKA21 TaxID=3381694 RepID=UPI003D1A5BCA